MKKFYFLLLLLFILLKVDNCIGQWIQSNNGITSGEYVTALSVYNNILYAGTSNGIYYSSNSGSQWVKIASNTGGIKSFAFNGAFYFASTSDGFWKSTDSGLS